MRLLSTTIYGISPAYRAGPATLNVAGLPGVLTAVTGANGAGKSTLLGAAILGAIYRKIPKLGGTRTTSLASLAQGRGAYVESRFDFGGALGEMTFRQTVDAGDERPEALLLGAGRQRHRDLPTTSVKAFDAWVGERLQPYEVIASGLFLAQQNNGLVRMTEGDRKSVILRAIGADRLERLAEAARRRATAAAEDLATTTGSLAVARERAASPAAAREALTAAERALAESHGAARVARDGLQLAQRRAAMASQHDATIGRLHALDVARADARRTRDGIGDVSAAIAAARALDERIATVREEWADAARAVEYGRAACERFMRDAKAAETRLTATRQRYQADRERLEAEHASATATLADRERRLANNRALLADADVIYAAERRVAEIDAAMTQLRAECATHVAASDAARSREAMQNERRDAARARHVEAMRQASQARGRLTGASTVRDAVASLPGAIAAQDVAAAAELAARAHVDALREAAATSWQRRHGALRAALVEAAGDAVLGRQRCIAALNDDDVAAVEVSALPDAITAATAAARVAEKEHAAARGHRQRIEALAAHADEVARDEATVVAAEGEARAATAVAESADAAAFADTAEHERQRVIVRRLDTDIATLQRERDGLAQRARHAPRLATAEERVAELTREVAADRAALKRTCDALEALPQALARDKAPDIAASDEASREAASAREALATATTRRDVLADDVAALREQRAALGDPDALAAEADRATATLATLAPQIAGVEGELAAIAQAIRELGDDVLTVADATAALSHAQEQQRDAAVAEARALDAVEEADEAEARVGRLDTARLDAARELREWTVLAAELGRDGLQADLVDSVAPELTETANDLLRASLGSRWRVRFEASKINGKGAVVEGFALRVIDTVMGREDDAADFCGGETALIGSAIADAVAVVGCKRAQLEAPVLVRDEGDAALGAENRRPWIEMLRRTAAITGASRVFVISHRDDVVALCDSVVDIADGRITVRS